MSIKTRIEAYSGTIGAEPIADYFHDALKNIVSRIIVMRPELATLFGKSTAVNTAGEPITGTVLEVTYNNFPCRAVDSGLRKKLDDATSIYATTSNDPAYYILGNKVFVSPDPGVSGTPVDISGGGVISDHADGTNINIVTHGLIAGELINIYGTTGTKAKYLNGDWRVVTVVDTDNFTIEADWTEYNANWTVTNTYYVQHTASVMQTAIDSAVDTDTDTVDNFPDELIHLPVYYAAASALNRKLSDLSLPGLPSLPIPPSEPTLGSPAESLPIFNEPIPLALPAIPADLDIDIDSFVPPALTLPDTITAPSFDDGATGFPSSAPTYTNITTDIDTITGSSNDTSFSGVFDRALEFAKAGDTEEASGVTAALNTYLSGVQAKISDSTAQMQANLSHYQAEMQSKTATAANLLQSDIQEHSSHLNKYSQEVNAVISAFGQELQIWSTNISSRVQVDSVEAQDKLAKYQADVGAQTALYNSSLQTENAKFQALVNKYTLELQTIAQSNNELVSLYNAAIQIYGGEANNAIQLYTAAMNSYTTDYKRLGQGLTHVTGLLQDSIQSLVTGPMAQAQG